MDWSYIFFIEQTFGAGLGIGVSGVLHAGIAYDEIGKTQFIMTAAIYGVNQIDPKEENFVLGASASQNVCMKQNWKSETFSEAIDLTGSSLSGAFSVHDLIGVTFGTDNQNEATFGFGIGIGIEMLLEEMKVVESISVTDAQASELGQANKWRIREQTPILNENNEIVGYKETIFIMGYGGLRNSGIRVKSARSVDKNGNIQSNYQWKTNEYSLEKEAL